MLGASTLLAALALLGTAAVHPATATTIELHPRDLGLKNSDGSVNIPGLRAEAERLFKCAMSPLHCRATLG